jgi:hypothetical protein
LCAKCESLALARLSHTYSYPVSQGMSSLSGGCAPNTQHKSRTSRISVHPANHLVVVQKTAAPRSAKNVNDHSALPKQGPNRFADFPHKREKARPFWSSLKHQFRSLAARNSLPRHTYGLGIIVPSKFIEKMQFPSRSSYCAILACQRR